MTKNRKICFSILIAAFVIALAFALSFIIVNATDDSDGSYHKSDVIVANSNVKEVVCGEEFYTQFHVNSSNLTGDNEKAMLVGKSQNGIGVYSSASSMEFSYKNVVDFSDKTANDSVIEVYPMFGENFAKISDIQIKLTDTEDPSNTVVVHYEENAVDNLAIYARVIYRSKDIAVRKSDGHIFNGIRGAYLNNTAYGPFYYKTNTETKNKDAVNWGTGEICPFTMHLDYETKVVSSSYYSSWGKLVQNDIIDLDDAKHVGANYEWEGFTNGTAYISVSVIFSESVTDKVSGGVIVKSIDGVNLENDFQSENDYPVQSLAFATEKEYGSSLPYGAINVDYNIPRIISKDWFFGIAPDANISYVIEKENALGEYQATGFTGSNGGTHKFTEAGNYRIKYNSTNGIKTAEKTLDFVVKDLLAPILVGQTENYKTPRLNSYLYIPETVIGGGSGNLVKTEALFYNGKEIALDSTREVFVDKAGIISLKVEVTGYTGSTYVKYFPIEVVDGVFFSVENMPKLIRGNNAEELILPQGKAYNSADGSAVDITVTVDGAALGADRKLSTAKLAGEKLNVVYSAGGLVKEYEINVIENSLLKQKPSSYIVKNGNVTVEDSAGGIEINTSSNKSGFTWGYPVVSGYSSQELSFSLSQVSSNLDFEYIDIVLTDAAERYRDYSIRIFKESILAKSTVESLVQLNGNPENYIMNGALNAQGTSFNFYIKNNIIYNNKGILIKDISDVYNAQLSYVSFIFGGVTGEASIRLDTLSNQTMGYDAKYGWNDVSPVLAFPKDMKLSNSISLGESFTIPSCTPNDMTSSKSSVTVSVIRIEDGQVLLNEQSAEANNVITPTEVGSYNVDYAVMDGKGNSAVISYILTVLDLDTPVITIESKLEENVVLGSTVEFPKASAVDQKDGECEVKIFVRNLDRYTFEYAADGKYQFNELGDYEIIYQTHDLSWNYTQYIVRITVSEK